MRSVVRWATNNSPAMNTIMVASLLVGLAGLASLRREVFPEFELEIILVTVPYPGASPEEVEEGICEKIEEACRAIAGIKKQTSVAMEGAGNLVLELESNVKDVDKVLNEVRSEIDRIPSFPVLAEDPEVKQVTFRSSAIKLGVLGPKSEAEHAELELREITEEIRSELLQLTPTAPTGANIFSRIGFQLRKAGKRNAITQANIAGPRSFQIDVEVSEESLRKHGLSLRQIAQIIRRENIEMPGGTMKGAAQEVLIRGKNKRLTGEEIGELPLIKRDNLVALKVRDVAEISDEFGDESRIHEVDGSPALVISAERTSTEDLFIITDAVKSYAQKKQSEMPPGYRLVVFGDTSLDVADRMELLIRNGIQGLLLVFLVLAVFLELRLAFWVALGIPVSILGSCIVLYLTGQTLNMLSMFAFLLALGIVVDDAIVIGENIYAHRQKGSSFVKAAVEGTYEVLPSVVASISTTVIAFLPLMFVSGVMGKFIAVMPVAVIAMLVISLVESVFILPCHLAHKKNLFLTICGIVLWPFKAVATWFKWANAASAKFLDWTIHQIYLPSLSFSIRNPLIVLSTSFSILLVAVGFVKAGFIPFDIFPKLDSPRIAATIRFPDGTPSTVTDAATRELRATIDEINEQYSGDTELVKLRYRSVGSIAAQGPMGGATGGHIGKVDVELAGVEDRNFSSEQIISMWRDKSPEFPGTESLKFGAQAIGPSGKKIEFKLLAKKENWDQLKQVADQCKIALAEYEGVKDIELDSTPGKTEFQFRIKKEAESLGVTAADLAETLRATYYGEEVMRLQRGRHEVKLMVRYPKNQRRSLSDLNRIRVRTNEGIERPITEIADIQVKQGYSEINRIDQLRSITVSADVDMTNPAKVSATRVVNDMRTNVLPEMLARPENEPISVSWEGEQETQRDSIQSMMIGMAVALMAMYVLLTLEFQSYLQPMLIMAVIPFGFVGAVWGHSIMQISLTMFSLFGLVALTGVVVNDSIVLIDFINARRRDGLEIHEALLEAGKRRFRPVLLTSLTTVAGLLPLLLETSFQAQVLIPMATSLSFGLMLATVMVLYLIPTFYAIYVWILSFFVSTELSPHEEESIFENTDKLKLAK